MAIIFKYKLDSYGWAHSRLTVGEKKMEFVHSYLSAPVADLLEFLSESVKNGIEDYYMSWKGEPEGYEWKIKPVKTKIIEVNRIKIEILGFDDVWEHKGKSVLYRGIVDFWEFATAIVKGLDKEIKKHGLVKYDELWRNEDFPVTDFLIVKKKLIEKGLIKKSRKQTILWDEFSVLLY